MSTRKTTLFYVVLIAVASAAVGMVIASQWGLPPGSSAQTVAVPATNSAPLSRADRRDDLPEHRQEPGAGRRQHPDAGAVRGRELTEFQGSDDLLGASSAGSAPRGPQGRGRSAARQEDAPMPAGRRHRLHHRQGGLHPHQQPRRRGRRRDPGRPLRREHVEPQRASLRREGRRPRHAHRQRAHPADRDAGGAAAGSQVRRLRADAAGRLGHGDRQPVQPEPHRHRRRHLGARPAVRRRARAARRTCSRPTPRSTRATPAGRCSTSAARSSA